MHKYYIGLKYLYVTMRQIHKYEAIFNSLHLTSVITRVTYISYEVSKSAHYKE